jgi:serine/threonine protein kinase
MNASVKPPSESSSKIAPELSAQVMHILEEYLAQLERGMPPPPEELLALHPELAEPLREYLASLEFLHRAAVKLRSGDQVQETGASGEVTELGQLGDYRLLREVGRGGMGIVYEADQVSLSRRVALKVLPFAAALDPKQLQRFKNEAQAAAHLHHTNIVPVFGVGCERGVHYYAMQFIAGETLAEVIHQLRLREQGCLSMPASPVALAPGDLGALTQPRSPAECPTSPMAALHTERSINSPAFFRTVANLGVQAAEALEHAHQLGVVHRDIKPANLLVDVRGNLWITDFGLAQVQSNAGLTLTGDIVGTLRYMSPEQALAKRALIDHRTDIYSLGVTLYELLTLEPAFPGRDREELLRHIAFEEPCRPRKLNPVIPADLETIIGKAIEKNPAERYLSAQELADDLRRFLEDKPIQAKRPTLVQRARKWSRRHSAVVGAGIMVIGTAVVALAVTSVFIWNAKQVADGERDNAKAQALRAENEHQAAEKSFREAKKTVDDFFRRVSREKLLQLPGSRALRKELLQQALAYYQHFLEERGNDPALEADVALTQKYMGEIINEIGSKTDALASYERARTLFEKLVGENKHDPPIQTQLLLDLALVHISIGGLHKEMRHMPQALQSYRQARTIYEDLAVKEPHNEISLDGLAGIYVHIANVFQEDGSAPMAEIMDLYQKAAETFQKLVDQFPEVHSYSYRLATTYYNMALLCYHNLRYEESITFYEQAKERLEKVVEAYGQEAVYRNALARVCNNLGVAQFQLGRRSQALSAWEQARDLIEKMAAENPEVTDYKDSLAGTYTSLAMLYESLNRKDEGLAAYQQAVTLLEEIVAKNPLVPEFQYHLACNHLNLGSLQSRVAHPDQAVASYDAAGKIADELVEKYPDLPLYRHLQTRILINMGILADHTGKREEALHSYETARIIIQDKLLRKDPENPDWKGDLAMTWGNTGETLRAQGRLEEALKAYQRAAVLLREAVEKAPGVVTFKELCFTNTGNLARILSELGKVTEAIATVRDLRRILPAHPQNYYQMASAVSLCIPAIAKGKNEPTDQDRAQQRQLGDQAMEDLRYALVLGYSDVEHLKKDPNLDPLRSRDDFKKLVLELEEKAKK